MKPKIFYLLFVLTCSLTKALGQQAPPAMFNYQGAARTTAGQPLSDKRIALQISILDQSESGRVLYSEVRHITTSPLGLYNIQIGGPGATSQQGAILDINWGNGSKFVRVEIDPDNGSNFRQAGVSQLLSVPYALFAGNASAGVPSASWNAVETKLPATSNAESIYQQGHVGVMTSSPLAALDVRGAVRFGEPVMDAVIGEHSAAFGLNNSASGNYGVAFGMSNQASGTYSAAFGTTNTAAGSRSTVFGTMSEVTGHYSTSFGSSNKVAGWMSTAIGGNLRAAGNFQTVVGTNNALTDPEQTAFQVGNGDPNRPEQLSNALTVMKSGHMGVGSSTATPNSTLQVYGSLSMPVRVLNGGMVTDGDYTVLVRGQVQLPPASSANTGRIYQLVNDRPESAQVTAGIRIGGQSYPGFRLDSGQGSRGITLQSDGQAWVLIGQF